MKESGEHPLIPEPAPEEETHYWRFESSDLDIDKLTEYLHSTAFESEEELLELLTRKYHMSKRSGISEIEMGMTRSWDLSSAIDVVDENGVLEKYGPRSRDADIEIVKKIRDAWMHKKSHVFVNGFGLLLNEEKMEKLDIIFKGEPLSGIDPQAVARVGLKTLDGKDFDLRIFRVYNRNSQFRYEYILKDK